MGKAILAQYVKTSLSPKLYHVLGESFNMIGRISFFAVKRFVDSYLFADTTYFV